MKRIKQYFLALMAPVFMLSACNKYLDLRPEDGVVREEFWQTKEQVAAAVNGCYASMLNPDVTEKLFLWGELRADMVEPGSVVMSDDLEVKNVNVTSNNMVTDWSSIYEVINYCNDVIDSAPLAMENDKTFTQQALNEYVGQALAIRSLMYFYLARSFGDVPLKLHATHSDSDNLQIPKSSQQEVLNQIVNDLKTAEDYVVTSYANKDDNKGRITKHAVRAMLADVYLWMDRYDECIAYCDKLINSGQFTLVPGDNNWFNTLYYQGGSVESIFELYFNVNRTNSFYNMFAAGSKRLKSTLKVYEIVYTVDPLDPENKDIRGDGGSYKISDGSIWKYHGVNASSSRGSSNASSYAHWFFYRYPDILLMKAEALNELGNGAEALDIIRLIRERANALPGTERIVEADDRPGVADYILEERAREFAFEGKRWYDVLRNAKRNNYARLDLMLDLAVDSAEPEFQASAVTKYRDFNSHYFPYFFAEMEANKALVQNPFYQ